MSARSDDAIDLTTFTSAIDLTSVSMSNGREIDLVEVVAASGTATITGKTAGSGAAARTFTVATGSKLDVKMRTIDSVSNVTIVRVFWSS